MGACDSFVVDLCPTRITGLSGDTIPYRTRACSLPVLYCLLGGSFWNASTYPTNNVVNALQRTYLLKTNIYNRIK